MTEAARRRATSSPFLWVTPRRRQTKGSEDRAWRIEPPASRMAGSQGDLGFLGLSNTNIFDWFSNSRMSRKWNIRKRDYTINDVCMYVGPYTVYVYACITGIGIGSWHIYIIYIYIIYIYNIYILYIYIYINTHLFILRITLSSIELGIFLSVRASPVSDWGWGGSSDPVQWDGPNELPSPRTRYIRPDNPTPPYVTRKREDKMTLL